MFERCSLKTGHLIVAICLLIAGQLAHGQDKYAILIGVESYTEDFQPLDYAEDDAKAIDKILSNAGFQTILMTGDQKNSALKPTTPKKILRVLDTRLKSCGNGDTMLVFLSGHGIQFKDDRLLDSGIRETYFCPEDADKDDKSTLVPVNDAIIKRLNNCAATRKLLLIDACRENVLSEAGQKSGTVLLELSPVHESSRSVPGGMSVLFSCESEQSSWEHAPLKHSVFSYFIIQYLTGKARKSDYANGNSTLLGLTNYVSKKTNTYVQDKNLSSGGQFPVLRGSAANWPFFPVKIKSQPVVKKTPVLRSTSNTVGMEFKLLPRGEFLMGSPSKERFRQQDETQHKVEITDDFWIGTTEVTQGQWRRVMQSTPWESEDGALDGKQYAASFISWEAANEFCLQLSIKEGYDYRLPTEAEWEYACRANTNTMFSFGDNIQELGDYGWLDANASYLGRSYAHPTGRKKSNPFGLDDMHGNVWEWCSDWYSSDYYDESPLRDPQGPKTGTHRAIRGGCFL